MAVADWLTVELFEARMLLLLQAAAWLEFARLSPLQKALRSVVVKLMESDDVFRPVRDIMWVLDPQRRGHVSSKARNCMRAYVVLAPHMACVYKYADTHICKFYAKG